MILPFQCKYIQKLKKNKDINSYIEIDKREDYKCPLVVLNTKGVEANGET